MIYASQYGGGLPFGSVIRGRDLPSPEFERYDGRTKVRADNLRLSAKFPIGKLTGTIRALASANSTNVPAIATANHFITAGTTNTTSAIQYSTDAASWATATTPAFSPIALLATPTRLIALGSGASAPIVSANLAPNSTWSTTTGGPTSVSTGTSKSRLCYVPGSPGRAVAVHNTAGVSTLDEGSTTWAARTSSARTGVAFSGTKVIGITAGSATASASTDGGVTFADFPLLEPLSANQGNIASNGSGAVGISGSPSGLQVSYDGGDTLQFVQIPGVPPSDTWQIQFVPANGGSPACFMVPTAKGLAMSLDLRYWQIDPTQVQALSAAVGIAKKGSTILQIPGGSTTAYSLLESSTEYRLPDVQEFTPSVSGVPTPLDPTFIKAL